MKTGKPVLPPTRTKETAFEMNFQWDFSNHSHWKGNTVCHTNEPGLLN